MPRRGSREMRNVGHKGRRARLFAEAATDDERLRAAWDWFRSSVELLARRRPPLGVARVDKDANRDAAARVKTAMIAHLKATAEAVDCGDYDAKEMTVRDHG